MYTSKLSGFSGLPGALHDGACCGFAAVWAFYSVWLIFGLYSYWIQEHSAVISDGAAQSMKLNQICDKWPPTAYENAVLGMFFVFCGFVFCVRGSVKAFIILVVMSTLATIITTVLSIVWACKSVGDVVVILSGSYNLQDTMFIWASVKNNLIISPSNHVQVTGDGTLRAYVAFLREPKPQLIVERKLGEDDVFTFQPVTYWTLKNAQRGV